MTFLGYVAACAIGIAVGAWVRQGEINILLDRLRNERQLALSEIQDLRRAHAGGSE